MNHGSFASIRAPDGDMVARGEVRCGCRSRWSGRWAAGDGCGRRWLDDCEQELGSPNRKLLHRYAVCQVARRLRYAAEVIRRNPNRER